MMTSVAALFLGVMFLCSGLVVNAFQLLALVLVYPLSLRGYRQCNAVLLEAFWSQLVWLVDWWGGLEVRIYTDNKETWDSIGREHALVICNHRSDVDWVVGWVMAQRKGCLGGTRAVMKKSVQYLPVIGWSMWMGEYIFLSRNWSKDRAVIERGLKRLRGFPGALWVALFVEGTRFTPQKLKAAQEFAASAGLPVPRNTLVPRTKGFVATVDSIRSFVPVIYDMTVKVPEGGPEPTFLSLVQRKKSVIHIHVRRVFMTDLPKDEAGIADWCKQAFVEKDEMLEAHKKSATFGEELYIPAKRSLIPLFVTLGWTLLLVLAAAFGIRRAVLANAITWNTVSVVAVLLVVVGGIIQWFLMFTQSKHSTSADKLSSKKTK